MQITCARASLCAHPLLRGIPPPCTYAGSNRLDSQKITRTYRESVSTRARTHEIEHTHRPSHSTLSHSHLLRHNTYHLHHLQLLEQPPPEHCPPPPHPPHPRSCHRLCHHRPELWRFSLQPSCPGNISAHGVRTQEIYETRRVKALAFSRMVAVARTCSVRGSCGGGCCFSALTCAQQTHPTLEWSKACTFHFCMSGVANAIIIALRYPRQGN